MLLYRSMIAKHCTYLLILAMLIGCGNQTPDQSTNSISSHDLEELSTMHSQNFDIKQKRLRYGNDLLILQAIPFIDSLVKDQYTVNVSLYNSSDTVLKKSITTDSVINALITLDKHHDTISTKLLKAYQMTDIVPTNHTKGYNSYFIAQLSSTDQPDFYIHFAIKAFGDRTTPKRKIWIQRFTFDRTHFDSFNNDDMSHHHW